MPISLRDLSLPSARTFGLLALLLSTSLFEQSAEARQRGKNASPSPKASDNRADARDGDNGLARPAGDGPAFRPSEGGATFNGGAPSPQNSPMGQGNPRVAGQPGQGGQMGQPGQMSPSQGGQMSQPGSMSPSQASPGQASPGQMSPSQGGQPTQGAEASRARQPGGAVGQGATQPGGANAGVQRGQGASSAASGRPDGMNPGDRATGGGSTARSSGDRGSSSHQEAGGSSGSSNSSGSSGSGASRGQAHRESASHSSAHGAPPSGGTRAYDRANGGHDRPPSRSHDHRYARPDYRYVRAAPHAYRPPPAHLYYNGWYAHWYVHPYYRSVHATYVVVNFGFVVNPWVVTWAPPVRVGWAWSAGFYDAYGYWHPGYFAPVAPAPVRASVHYVYVPGWWQGDIYVEGYYRVPERSGWAWQEGYYLEDGTYVAGHWQPAGAAPEGYTWEAGFFDGETWVEGFWRPEFRSGYTWVSAYYDAAGVYQAGYWMPVQDQPGYTWIPGWFDGNRWVEGYWVSEAEYQSADPANWEAPEGWNEGWDAASASAAPAQSDELPLALPVE